MSALEQEIKSGLLSFYESKFAAWEYIRVPAVTKISDGWENEVYSFAVEYKKNTEQIHEDLILRVYPGDDARQKSAKEFDGMKKLHKLGFPVPEVFMLEVDNSPFGKPFVIMEKIEGRSMWSVLDESTDERKLELIDLFFRMLVDLHALDWRPFASDPSIYETGDKYAFIDNLLPMWRKYMEDFQANEYIPILDWLTERSRDVPCDRLSVIHMDYHTNNVLMRDDGTAFVIDWTSIDVADYRLDLAWTIVLANPEHRDPILGEYERVSGRKIQEIEYFEVIAGLRRLFSISVSLSDGAARMGMRPEAAEMMKSNVGHIKDVYSLMCDRTGIAIPEVETMISSIS